MITIISFGTAYTQCVQEIGSVNPGYSDSVGYGGDALLGVAYNVPISGTLVALNLYGLGTNANVQMALYADNSGKPSNLIAQSVVGVVTNGPVSLPVINPVFISPGTYWIMTVYDNFGSHALKNSNGNKTVYWQNFSIGNTMPAHAGNFKTYCCRDFQYWMTLHTPNPSSTISDTACFSYKSPSGKYLWDTTGTYMDTVPHPSGCDSLVTVNLTVNEVDTLILLNNLTLSSSAQNATFQWLLCDNNYALVQGANDSSFTITQNGSYALEITQNGCTDTSTCVVINNVGLKNSQVAGFTIYPNPGNNLLNLNMVPDGEWYDLTLINTLGQVVYMEQLRADSRLHSIIINCKPGLYMVRLVSNQKNYVRPWLKN
ncbi:MAG: T9SS type A sorting domain-containing protein [Owenweeksia sp.]